MINRNKFTIEEFKNRLNKINSGWQYTIVEFNGYKQACKIKCNNCNQILSFNKAADIFKKVNPCNCKKIFKNYHEKIQHLAKQFNFTILFDGNARQKIEIKCNSCGFIMKRSLVSVLNTPWYCGNCNNYNQRKIVYTKEDVQDELNKKFNFEYELLEYTGMTKKALLKHLNCGKIFTIRELEDLLQGRNRGCPICYQFKSMGEQKIMQYLEQHKINYIPQKTFAPLNKSKYRFDFYLPEFNLAIEYQGEQHYKEKSCFKDSLKTIQQRDKIKREYCLKNNIILREIKYTELKNINHILDSMFKDYRKLVSNE